MSEVKLFCGDCLVILPDLPGPFDMVLADLPYGMTACKCDTVIPFEPLWAEYKRLIKPRGAVVLFGSQPFTSALVMSNLEWFKWEDIWYQSHATGHLNCKVMPLRQHKNIIVFGKGRVTYNPQLQPKPADKLRPFAPSNQSECYGSYARDHERTIPLDMSYPRSVVEFSSAYHSRPTLHPNQKPVPLLEYLIRTYTNKGETVLDNVMGSGSTGVACVNTGRSFVGIEKEPEYSEIARQRIEAAQTEIVQAQMAL